ncbi:MAG TPA: hypothetical protein VMS31_07130 [Pyrinomonadaceae bacterium]|nr:hypothetical protein [Pyrinomonadaceae bacterium]
MAIFLMLPQLMGLLFVVEWSNLKELLTQFKVNLKLFEEAMLTKEARPYRHRTREADIQRDQTQPPYDQIDAMKVGHFPNAGYALKANSGAAPISIPSIRPMSEWNKQTSAPESTSEITSLCLSAFSNRRIRYGLLNGFGGS